MSFILSPAASGGTITMTAASAITAQRPVAVNTSGQAFEIGVTATTTDITLGVAQPTTPVAGYGSLAYNAYDPVNDRYLYLSVGSGTQKPSVFVVQLTDTGIVFGTPVALNTNTAINLEIGTVAYDATAQKFLVTYLEATTAYPAAVVVTINPTTNSATLGTPTVVSSNALLGTKSSVFYNAGIGKCVLSWVENATNNTIRAAVATITGTNVTFGATATFVTPSTGIVSGRSLSGVAHPTNGKFLILCGDTSYVGFNACAATVSGTTITFGTPVQFNPGGVFTNYAYGISNGIWDPLRSQFIFAVSGVSNGGYVFSFTITGTTTVNSIAVTSTNLTFNQGVITDQITYNSVNNVIDLTSNAGVVPVVNTGSALNNGTGSAAFITTGSIAYSSIKNRIMLIGNQIGQAANGLTNYTAGTYVGIASSSVSGGSPCVINVIGSSATVSGAAPGSGYAIQTIGGLVPVTTLTLGTYAGVSTASNTILLKG